MQAGTRPNVFNRYCAQKELKDRSRREIAARKMFNFILYTYPDFLINWHHRLVCHYLDKWANKEILRLMIWAPPRHSKSLMVSERLPAFILGRNPFDRVMATSYGQSLADKMSRKARACVESTEFNKVFPVATPSTDRWAVHDWELALGGGYKCAGTGGGITGLGFDYGIIDDPHKDRKSAESTAARKAIIDWYHSVFYFRRQPSAAILIMQTRWHPDDLCGHLVDKAKQDPKADQWVILDLPAILDRPPIIGDIRQQGEALWPSRYSLNDLQQVRINSGSYEFDAQYQQQPQPPGGSKIKRDWFEVIDKAPGGLNWVRFWDLAVSKKTSADYTAGAALAINSRGQVFIRDMVRGQWSWPESRRTILQTAKADKPKVPIGVEKAGQQEGFIDDLSEDREFLRYAVTGHSPDGDKLTRALPWIAKAEAGKVKLVKGGWVTEFLSECQAFTGQGDKHDDQIDAVSGAYNMACDHDPTGGITI